MTFATIANVTTILFCAAVLVQSVRMMRSLKAVRRDAFAEMVAVVDRSTGEARAVLSELKVALSHCATTAQTLDQGKAMIDELTVMIGIADASANHMADAASAARRAYMAERG